MPELQERGGPERSSDTLLTGRVKLALLRSTDNGATWTTNFFATSQQQPPCTVKSCPGDFFGSQSRVAVDSAGTVMVAWCANSSAGAPMTMYAAKSTNNGST